ncbi:MAG: hypothetical protein K1060chlam5_00944 [Candidatus Anoxychlamydiales bacterium]|nr:hypothetical protein [Candidatus Anoxychlamydiales bacterium]
MKINILNQTSISFNFIFKRKFFFSSLLFTFLFYFQAFKFYPFYLVEQDNSFCWLPQLVNVIALLKKGGFYGIDFFTWGGSSEFFLRPNLLIYYPVLLFLAIIPIKFLSIFKISFMITLIYSLHSFFCCYFLQKLCKKFLKFDYSSSLFISIGYTFSFLFISKFIFFTFNLHAWLFPIGIYFALKLSYNFSIKNLLFYSLPFLMIFTSGYLPFSILSIIIISLLIFLYHFYLFPTKNYKKNILISLLPILVASIIAFPLYLEITKFHKIAFPGKHSLFDTAYFTSFSPSALINMLSKSLSLPLHGRNLFYLGPIGFSILILFIKNFKKDYFIKTTHYKLFNISIIIYLIFLLSCFGSYSAFSDLFYYFTGPIGKMHSYHRYLTMINLFLFFVLAIMLNHITDIKNYPKIKKIIFGFLSIFIILLFLKNFTNGFISKIFNEQFFIEYFLAFIFLMSLLIYNKNISKTLATIFIFSISLTTMYNHSNNILSSNKNNLEVYKTSFLKKYNNYFKKNSTKELIRYINIVPGYRIATFPKNYPWFFNHQKSFTKISSFYGYDAHLATDFNYRMYQFINVIPDLTPGFIEKYPITKPQSNNEVNFDDYCFFPNVSVLKDIGTDFIIFQEDFKYNDLNLIKYVDFSDKNKILKITDNQIIAPLKFPKDPLEKFNNGYIKILSEGNNIKVHNFKTNQSNYLRLNYYSDKPSKIYYLFWPNKHLIFYINNKKALPNIENNIMSIKVNEGNNKILIKYYNPILFLFLIFYFCYFFILSFILILQIPYLKNYSNKIKLIVFIKLNHFVKKVT